MAARAPASRVCAACAASCSELYTPPPGASTSVVEANRCDRRSAGASCTPRRCWLAALLALALHAVWPVALVGAASLVALLGLGRGRYTPAGAFGAANAVTLLRLVLIAALALIGLPQRGELAALLMFAVFALDGVDGWLARSRQLASAFGARFDMECDALLVLVGSLLLYLRGRLPAFILLPGALRYAYVLALAWLPGALASSRARWSGGTRSR